MHHGNAVFQLLLVLQQRCVMISLSYQHLSIIAIMEASNSGRLTP
jgi:hypothetical protein